MERSIDDRPGKGGLEREDRTHPEPGDLADRADDAGMDVDDDDQGGDQDIDTAGIRGVDTESKGRPAD